MVRNLLILLVFLGIGFGANVAQSDIFVRSSPKEDSSDGDDAPKKKSIFIRQFRDTSDKIKKAKKSLGNALNLSGISKKTTDDMRVLAYWQQTGKKPGTAQELEFYAKALRGPELASVMAERAKVAPVLEALRAKRLSDFQERMRKRAPNVAGLAEVNAMILSDADRVDLGESTEVVQAVYTNLRNQAIEKVQATAQKPRKFQKNIRTSTPIYRRVVPPSSDNADDSGSAAGGVYKSY